MLALRLMGRLADHTHQGSYALYPNNDATQVAKKGAGGGMLFVICVFVLAYGCSWGPGGWVNSMWLMFSERCTAI